MTKENFIERWTTCYPETHPIPHLFRHVYPDRRFRIHSLPDDKRYAQTEAEWNILLSRQNQLITDLLGEDMPVFLVRGEIKWSPKGIVCRTEPLKVWETYSFISLESIDLHALDPIEYEELDRYLPSVAHTNWTPNAHDDLLKVIADDLDNAFFVSFEKNILIAPYDGGVDVILKDQDTKEVYQRKYHEWVP